MSPRNVRDGAEAVDRIEAEEPRVQELGASEQQAQDELGIGAASR
jgi:hypothetical protein